MKSLLALEIAALVAATYVKMRGRFSLYLNLFHQRLEELMEKAPQDACLTLFLYGEEGEEEWTFVEPEEWRSSLAAVVVDFPGGIPWVTTVGMTIGGICRQMVWKPEHCSEIHANIVRTIKACVLDLVDDLGDSTVEEFPLDNPTGVVLCGESPTVRWGATLGEEVVMIEVERQSAPTERWYIPWDRIMTYLLG